MDSLSTIKNKFSIKNFIADLPRLLNECMDAIYTCIKKFYDEDSSTITCTNVKASKVEATTIIAQNLSLKNGTGTTVETIQSLIDKINELESRIKTVEINKISDASIDAL